MLVIQVEKFINKWSSTFRDKTYFVKNGRNSGGFCMSKKKKGLQPRAEETDDRKSD